MKALAVLLALLAPAAVAQPARSGPPSGWSAGVLSMSVSSPYRSADDDLLVVPVVQYEGERVYFRGLRLGYRLTPGQPWNVALVAQPRLLHLDREDIGQNTQIRDRKRSIDAGIAVDRQIGRIRTELVAVTDVLGRSNGQEVAGRVALPLRFGPLLLSPEAGVRFWSANMAAYYAGVHEDESGHGLSAYDPGSAVVPEVGLSARMPLTRAVVLTAQYRHRFLPGELRASPLIDDDYESSAFIGASYFFSRR
jgi:MipA family protein